MDVLHTVCIGGLSWCCAVPCCPPAQYQAALNKKVDDEKQRQKLYGSRVRQTDAIMVLLHTFCSGAALLLPCIVIHLTQVRSTADEGTE